MSYKITLEELDNLEKQQEHLKRKELLLELRNFGLPLKEAVFVAAAYVMYVWNTEGYSLNSSQDAFSYFKDENIRFYVQELFNTNVRQLLNISSRYCREDLLGFIFYFPSGYLSGDNVRENATTPESLCRLAIELLNVGDNDIVADFGTGTGRFILEAFKENPETHLFANELDTGNITVTRIKNELLGANIEIDSNDMFNYFNSGREFSKIFSNYPIGLNIYDSSHGAKLRLQLQTDIICNMKMLSGDWFFNYLLINCLSDNGKAVAIMSAGSTWNKWDEPAREWFVNKGLLETIIALPPNLFSTFNVPMELVVFSKGNDEVRMVDASKIFHKGRRLNDLRERDIDDILQAVSADSEISKRISRKVLADNEYILNPTRYMVEIKPVKNGVKFGSIIKSIRRGAQIKADALDAMSTSQKTNYQYLMLANIENNVISDNLPYLKEIDLKDEKYCLKDEDIVLSKIGRPFKIALAQVQPGRKILANGNLFLIEVDKKKVNPYYLQAYLNSKDGRDALNRIITGSFIPSISLTALKEMLIPMVSLKEQDTIAKKYLAKLDELAMLKIKIEKVQEELKSIYQQEGC